MTTGTQDGSAFADRLLQRVVDAIRQGGHGVGEGREDCDCQQQSEGESQHASQACHTPDQGNVPRNSEHQSERRVSPACHRLCAKGVSGAPNPRF
jgi:hypothetical protein